MTDLTALIARVERLEGPDREVDLDVHLALFGSMYSRETLVRSGYPTDKYTASLDAVVALAERVLPTHVVSVVRFTDGSGHAKVWRYVWDSDNIAAPTPTLALLLALLRAVREERTTEMAEARR